MRALVVYESMFGNTERIALAIAEGMSELVQAEPRDVATHPQAVGQGYCALAVGGPTHAFGLSRATTRRSAGEQGAAGPAETGVREWLAQYTSLAGMPAATFDTRIGTPWPTGSAARAVQKRLRRLGCRIMLPAEGFAVTGTAGPLRDGELARARRWGRTLAETITSTQPVG
ncbi:flavodoxin family protein [Catenuloplanes atrovinosus]|uniref:Flavodoxin-like domain-containing protein n=1 Tax=Catenuloplanes atrovinosus TaxID=137266 RepID=A0AAE3YLF9_9ACTN|nr:flavodoxin [Catenuloplanes atrovinosus]MDR7275675.1 hypothetical protein [Catenuloplanes atrovinosus]